MNVLKSFSVIHPLPFPTPMQSGGPSLTKCSLYFLRGKTNIGGIDDPEADTATSRVTLVPRSAEVIEPTVLFPLVAIIFEGFVTVGTEVSSRFHIDDALYFSRPKTHSSLSKNLFTLFSLNAVARAKLVASGVRIESWVFLFKKDVSQSFPAMRFFFPGFRTRNAKFNCTFKG